MLLHVLERYDAPGILAPYIATASDRTWEDMDQPANEQVLLEQLCDKSLAEENKERRRLDVINYLYWLALARGSVHHHQMRKLCEVFRETHYPWVISDLSALGFRKMIQRILQYMRDADPLVRRLASVSLVDFARGSMGSDSFCASELWVPDTLFELSQDASDKWSVRYLRGMAFCRLDWRQYGTRWLEAIKNSEDKKHQAWARTIVRAKCCEPKALAQVLLQILEAADDFPKVIKEAALERLALETEEQGNELDESTLNLPLRKP